MRQLNLRSANPICGIRLDQLVAAAHPTDCAVPEYLKVAGRVDRQQDMRTVQARVAASYEVDTFDWAARTGTVVVDAEVVAVVAEVAFAAEMSAGAVE